MNRKWQWWWNLITLSARHTFNHTIVSCALEREKEKYISAESSCVSDPRSIACSNRERYEN